MALYLGREISEDSLAQMVRAYKAGRDIEPEKVEGVEDPNQLKEEDAAIVKELEEAGVDPNRLEFARELGAGNNKDKKEAEPASTVSTGDRIKADSAMNPPPTTSTHRRAAAAEEKRPAGATSERVTKDK